MNEKIVTLDKPLEHSAQTTRISFEIFHKLDVGDLLFILKGANIEVGEEHQNNKLYLTTLALSVWYRGDVPNLNELKVIHKEEKEKNKTKYFVMGSDGLLTVWKWENDEMKVSSQSPNGLYWGNSRCLPHEFRNDEAIDEQTARNKFPQLFN